MVPTDNIGSQLFAEQLPSIEQIKQIGSVVNSSELNKINFEKNFEGASDLAAGIGLNIVGKYRQSVERLNKAADCGEKFLFLAWSLTQIHSFDKATEAYDKAAAAGMDEVTVAMSKVSNFRQAGNIQAAQDELNKYGQFANVSAEYHYQIGRIQAVNGEYDQAAKSFETAIDLDPKHGRALFQFAFLCDIKGDDHAAVDYYKQIEATSPIYINALLNLAVIYEDMGEYDKALNRVEAVLSAHPNHKKAELFAKDIENSKHMIYDEEKEKMRNRHNQILEIPISDFELSVRSRNCLKKMNIITLGDLLKTTEAELLAYKNFGETSLAEIKKILSFKGLRLGMALEEKATVSPKIMGDSETSEELLNKTVNDLELSVRARRCLSRLGLQTLGELASKTEAELLGCKNFGVTSLNEIKDRMAQYGISLRKLE